MTLDETTSAYTTGYGAGLLSTWFAKMMVPELSLQPFLLIAGLLTLGIGLIIAFREITSSKDQGVSSVVGAVMMLGIVMAMVAIVTPAFLNWAESMRDLANEEGERNRMHVDKDHVLVCRYTVIDNQTTQEVCWTQPMMNHTNPIKEVQR